LADGNLCWSDRNDTFPTRRQNPRRRQFFRREAGLRVLLEQQGRPHRPHPPSRYDRLRALLITVWSPAIADTSSMTEDGTLAAEKEKWAAAMQRSECKNRVDRNLRIAGERRVIRSLQRSRSISRGPRHMGKESVDPFHQQKGIPNAGSVLRTCYVISQADCVCAQKVRGEAMSDQQLSGGAISF
jgi:hypothetical protein